MNSKEFLELFNSTLSDKDFTIEDFLENYGEAYSDDEMEELLADNLKRYNDVDEDGQKYSSEEEIKENIKNDQEWAKDQKYFTNKFGSYKTVFEKRLSDRDHDTYRQVIHFKDHDVYLAFDGSYSSYNGVDYAYTKPFAVRPQQVTITKYVREQN